ncbi:MAG: excinuclease ABC subunit UvrC [Chloroflexi bacterium]|nr:excinuclease ABC subunit UvrC [Chloroflexota bacterium]
MVSISTELQETLDALPNKPGVYIMRDALSKIIYVGKAIILRNRVRSYFQPGARHPHKVARMVANVSKVEWIVTDSELEALILECNYIKQYQPRYNVRLKDDKRYPYIKVTWQDDFPKVLIVRTMDKDGARYFGPFTASWAVHGTLNTLRRIFPYLTCDREITGKDSRACLYYDIGLCLAPCIGAVDREDYRNMVDRMCRFLEGKGDEIVRDLEYQMHQAADDLQFERAARIRDQLRALEKVVEKQRIVGSSFIDQDVIALAREDGQACVQVFLIRQGKLIGREYFLLEGTDPDGENDQEIMASFLKQFYDEASHLPDEILLGEHIEEASIIETWLRNRRGTKVTVRVPRRGKGRQLIEMAAQNASETLAMLRAQWQSDTNKQTTAIAELQEALDLPQPTNRIECYDISNIQGTSSVGAMVVFVQGTPRKSDYRRFKIATVQGPNDFASLQEVLRRRLIRLKEARAQGGTGKPAVSDSRIMPRDLRPGIQDPFTLTPDLMIIDGGKGQLSAVLEVMEELQMLDIPVCGLAKEREEIFLPGRSSPVMLPRTSQGLYLVQRIRDEAHRFGLAHHRSLRQKRTLRSTLEEIPGIGPRRRSALLQKFPNLEAIRAASIEELATVPGMNRAVAQQIKANL